MNQDKLIVALDVSNLNDAEKLVKTLLPAVKIFKIGKELFTAEGPRAVEMVHSRGGKVFLDLKFHDIPSTVAGACEAAVRHGVFMMNVHALGGREMLQAAVGATRRLPAGEAGVARTTIVLGVTVLTSLSQNDLDEIGISKKLEDEVRDLAKLAKECGLNGVVASPREIEIIRKTCGKDFLIVTPGVRPAWASAGDQQRVMTPKEAVDKGASYIVVGRPITQAEDPKEAAERILNEM